MPKTKISEWSSTPANNTDIDSINIAEGCAPSGINDAIRELMAQLKDFQVGSAGDPVTVGGVLTVTAGAVGTPAITTAGDTNTGIFFPAADTIAFAEGGVEAMRLDSSGNLGIGTTNFAAGKLSVAGRMGAYNTTGANDSLIQIWHNGTTANISPTYSSTGAYAPLTFLTSDVERLRLPTAGGVQAVGSISVGNATPTTSGAGITFPATQSASTNANTLDDYEEGTWSPAIGGNATYYAQEGYYTKIGNIVYFYGKIIINSKGTGNNFTMTGFPFNANYNIRLNVQYWTLLATNVVFLGAIGSGNTQVDFHSTTAAASNVATNTVFGNGTTISFNGFYSV